jgi:hypothetical protein
MILGIDVAKDKVDVALCHDKQFSASGQSAPLVSQRLWSV